MSQTEHYDKLPSRDGPELTCCEKCGAPLPLPPKPVDVKIAPPKLRIKLPLSFRRFYEGRNLTTLAAKALLGEAKRMLDERGSTVPMGYVYGRKRGPAKPPSPTGRIPYGWKVSA